ncbi:hypothetical protein GNX18_06140 [Microbulbifer sp. SH-1]|uniref:hypothetical protein n=1 Tax=Microbulbifer sp. SH-1 TaxID=2681547 RepID=UPI00140BCEC1|nr:hypothetical protein [Microbulbifer sp. SH-1]QIL89387.1 hypothetical protein GNX18_06140 [Microbulbifer sp. SH-1]
MSTFWVIEAKVEHREDSSMPSDGCDISYGRSVVPAETKDEALELFKAALAEQKIYITEIYSITDYRKGDWSDDIFDLEQTYEKASIGPEISLGTFISQEAMDHLHKDWKLCQKEQ